MNYLDDLPDDLISYIYEFRDNDMASIIQRMWHRYYEKIYSFISISEQCYYYGEYVGGIIKIATPLTANIIEFIEKKIKKTDKNICWSSMWKKLLDDIYYGLMMEYFIGEEYNNDYGYKFYNRIEDAFYRLINKLDLKWQYDYEPEYFA